MNFDNKAQDWDKDQRKVERAATIAKEIKEVIEDTSGLTALEFGCGTGLLSFELKDHFKHITLADTSKGMIDVLKEKIEIHKISNFTPLQTNMLNENLKIKKVDVIYTLMTLHHIPELNKILNIFKKQLNPGGYLCIADLVKEDGSFHSHSPNFDGHNGFEKDELSAHLNKLGFEPQYYSTCLNISKKTEEGERIYPVFLMVSRKKA